MGRKSRKKGHNKQWVRRTPDVVLQAGPLRIERVGRHVVLSNNSTPEQHEQFMASAKKANRKILVELEEHLQQLQKQISVFDPVELMHRAAYMILPLMMKYRSESEFETEEALYLPAVEYLQYLISRSPKGEHGQTPSEPEWEELWSQLVDSIALTQSYLLTRGPLSDEMSEIDELRMMLDTRRLGIRVKRYSVFLVDYWKSTLEPYEDKILEHYGVNVATLIEGFEQILEYQKFGVSNRYFEFQDHTTELMDKLAEQGYSIDRNASPEEVERTQAALQSQEFRSLRDSAEEKARLTFTSAIFDITDLTTLPKSVLSLFSVRPGESILTSLSGKNHDDLSPLSPSILHRKPFLEADGRFYTFYHSGVEDHLADIIQDDLFEKLSDQKVSVLAKKRSDRLETDSMSLLMSIISPDFAFNQVYYPNPDDANGLTELDLLMGADDLLFLVEVKAGRFTKGANRGAPSSLASDLSDLIIEGQRQSERAERYIKSCTRAPFFDATGTQRVVAIDVSSIRRIFRIVVTNEDLGWVGARIASLSVLDPNLSKSYPWHIGIDDLRVVSELFSGDEIRFVHYLEQRLRASNESTLAQHDEIEHVGLYNTMNYYHYSPVQGVDHFSFDASYMVDIDHYFHARSSGETPPVPSQDMPQRMRELIEALRLSKLPHRFELGSLILSGDGTARDNLEYGLNHLGEGVTIGRERSFRVPFPDNEMGYTVTYAEGANWSKELRQSAVQMNSCGHNQWLVAQLSPSNPPEVLCLEVIDTDRFSDDELLAAKERHERTVSESISKTKPGRNQPCPCGSGKKFKRCHGR